jgi:hypothetical protein
LPALISSLGSKPTLRWSIHLFLGAEAMSQDIINAIISVGIAGFSWLLKTVWDAVNAVKAEVIALERQVHTSYVSKNDYRQDLIEIKDMLKQIFDKMDKKADK